MGHSRPQQGLLPSVAAFLSETFCDGARVHARNPRHVMPKTATRTVQHVLLHVSFSFQVHY